MAPGSCRPAAPATSIIPPLPVTSQPLIDFAVCIGAGWAAGLLAHGLKQPLLLGYLAAGFAVGPAGFGLVSDPHKMGIIGEAGLILLLFLLGLEMDFKKLRGMGRLVLHTAITQVVGSALIGFGCFWLLGGWLGGVKGLDVFYLAIAAALSSTVIGIKLLHDKRELGTLAGQITVGVLVFQDLAAILFVGLQPTLLHPSLGIIALTLGKVALLVGLALATSRYLLPPLFARVALRPELVVLGALAWCFTVASCADVLGLSRELGAITAGMAISTFPYALDIEAKVASLRDVFVTLFFVSIGLTLPEPSLRLVGGAGLIAVVLVFTRLVTVFIPVYLGGGGSRAALLATINLSQVCELSLVLVALGQGLKHLRHDISGEVTCAFALMAVASTYAINGSERLFQLARPLLRRLGLREAPNEAPAPPTSEHTDIFVLGFYRLASSLIEELTRQDPALLKRLTVVDFNPIFHSALRQRGVRVTYGDLSQRDTLEKTGIERARLILCTLGSWVLKGIALDRLVQNLRALNPEARIVVVTESTAESHELFAAGADHLVAPRFLAAAEMVAAIRAFDRGLLPEKRTEFETGLQQRREILD